MSDLVDINGQPLAPVEAPMDAIRAMAIQLATLMAQATNVQLDAFIEKLWKEEKFRSTVLFSGQRYRSEVQSSPEAYDVLEALLRSLVAAEVRRAALALRDRAVNLVKKNDPELPDLILAMQALE